MSGTDDFDVSVRRIGVLMEPEPGRAFEAEGVLNPGGARGRDGALYLFPRLVAAGNFSRIGIARVQFDDAGDPLGVERLGFALEPAVAYESRGCEDPRVTYVEALDVYLMTYTAVSERGPRVAMALSHDLFEWQRLGLVHFHPYRDIDFGDVPNKDAVLFPQMFPDSSGVPRLVLVDRPLLPGTTEHELADEQPREPDPERESIWVSYGHAASLDDLEELCCFAEHHRVLAPEEPWEHVKVGAGAPPVRIDGGWLLVYHGVSGTDSGQWGARKLTYSAGVLVLDGDDPRQVRHRSAQPLLTPDLPEERTGTVANVVFPTAIDRRVDIGKPERFDLYYGMADSRIGVAAVTFG